MLLTGQVVRWWRRLTVSQIYDHLPEGVPPAVLSHQGPYFYTPRFRHNCILNEGIEWSGHVEPCPSSVDLFKTRSAVLS